MAKQAGISGNQAAMRGMKTRGGARGSTPKPANMQQVTSALSRARAEYEKNEKQKIVADLRREGNRRKFSSRAETEARARADAAAGKIAKGQLGKTIDRRWNASRKRREKFETGQKEKEKTLLGELAERLKTMTPAEFGVQNVTATVTFRISSEDRETTLSFPASAGTMGADAREALANYVTSDHAHLVSATPVSWDDL